MKEILVDVDGVLVDWDSHFNEWMMLLGYELIEPNSYYIHERFGICEKHGYEFVKIFNDSHKIENLTPLRDAQDGLKILYDHGYQFTCITSFSNKPTSIETRKRNLFSIFDEKFFKDIICLPVGSSKIDILKQYNGNFWIEDKPTNAEDGFNLGLNTIIVEHPHNMLYNNNLIVKCATWHNIVNIILGEHNGSK